MSDYSNILQFFNDYGTTFYKIISENSKLKNGLNVNSDLYTFYNLNDIALYLDDGSYICKITIPKNATKIYINKNYGEFKTDKIIIASKQALKDLPQWDNLNFCLNAVSNNGLALEFVKNQTPEIVSEALQRNQYSEKFIIDKKYWE